MYGNGIWGPILTFAGFVSVNVEDEYNNSISNLPIEFQAGSATVNPAAPNCANPGTETKKAYLLDTSLACLKSAPAWGECGDTSKQALPVITDNTGASAHLILGDLPDAIYPITAVCKDLGESRAVHGPDNTEALQRHV